MNIEYFKLAQYLNEVYKHILLKENVHFRASLNSISMISISNEKPELGVKCNSIKYASAENFRIMIEQYIGKIEEKTKPERPTPEKELQSWIINYALNNNHCLPFDSDIKFITSELAIKDKDGAKIVTDILGYRESNNQLCVIELKSDRLFKRLKEQVNNFEEIIIENPEFFSQLLLIHGFAKPNGVSKNINKIVVWPHEKTSPKKELKNSDIQEFTYQEHYTFLNHG